jgi:hypothetical protein
MSISFVLITFLLQMAVGMMATVAILPTKLVDGRFFKSISFWALLFLVSALVLKHYSLFNLSERFGGSVGDTAVLALLGKILFYLFGAFTLLLWIRLKFKEGNASRWQLAVISMTGIAALVFDAFLYRPDLAPIWAQSLLIPLNFVSTALILGGFLAGMIFGHYYLVNTEMPKRLLVTMAWILIGVLILRIAAVGTTLLLYKEVIRPDSDFLAALTSFQGHGIFFWQRILVGLAIPAIVVAMIWSTARIGSNQSATGIMYVAIAFVFIGELAARYLFLLSAIPL